MRKSVFHTIWGAVSALQILLVGGVLLLSRLAHSKGGVNHHVAYRKRQYNELLFTERNVLLMQVILLVLLLLLLWALVHALKRRRRTAAVLAAGCVLLAGVLLFELTAPAFRAIAVYPYAVLVTALLFSLECALLMLYKTVGDTEK